MARARKKKPVSSKKRSLTKPDPPKETGGSSRQFVDAVQPLSYENFLAWRKARAAKSESEQKKLAEERKQKAVAT